MDKFAMVVILSARAGKEQDAEAFLTAAQPLAAAEPGTTSWFAVKLESGRYGIFDTFRDERSQEAHLGGEVTKALVERAGELFSEPPLLYNLEVLAAKTPGAELPEESAAA